MLGTSYNCPDDWGRSATVKVISFGKFGVDMLISYVPGTRISPNLIVALALLWGMRLTFQIGPGET